MTESSSFASVLKDLRRHRGLSYRGLADESSYSKSYLEELEKGAKPPNEGVARILDRALDAGGRLYATVVPTDDGVDDELDASELVRRVTSSDVSNETLDRLERAADKMAMAYTTTPPIMLLPRVRKHLGYVGTLVAARKTLDQQKRLLVVGGWLSLLRATIHIDLRQAAAADAHLDTAAALAEQTGHVEISGWVLETRAWDALTAGDYRLALQLSQHAQEVAPAGGSAIVQATAQEGRAWARLGDRVQTGHALTRVESLADHRPQPDQPEHHYKYDPAKARAYAATTLAWAGDPAAEAVAREVIDELVAEGARPRRIASAQLDLGLALLSAGQPDEADTRAREAILSGRIVPSNWWRVVEVVSVGTLALRVTFADADPAQYPAMEWVNVGGSELYENGNLGPEREVTVRVAAIKSALRPQSWQPPNYASAEPLRHRVTPSPRPG